MASHTVFTESLVLDNPKKFKITCMDRWDKGVIVGGSDGSLHIYEPDPANPLTWKETRSREEFAKKTLEQLVVVKFQGKALLLALVDSVVKIFSLPSLLELSSLDRYKGAYMFAVNKCMMPAENTGNDGAPLSLCIALKKKELSMFLWDKESKFVHWTNVPVTDTVKSVEWAGNSICVGNKKEYLLIRVQTALSREIFPVGGRRADITLLPNRELLLLQNRQGICVNYDGEPRTTRSEAIMWSDTPEALAYFHPFTIAALSNSVEVKNINPRRGGKESDASQVINIKGVRFISRNCSVDSDDESSYPVFIANSTTVKCLHHVPLMKQLEELVKRELYLEAIEQVRASATLCWSGADDEAREEERKNKLTDLYTLYAYRLFNEGNYHEAMRAFYETDCNPRQILALFEDADVLPGGQIARVVHPARVTRIHRQSLSDGQKGEDRMLMALSALIPYLCQLRGRLTLHHDCSRRNRPSGGLARELSRETELSEGEMPLIELVDTVLLKAYLLSDGALVMPFLQNEEGNHCNLEEGSNILRTYHRYAELVCLYQGRAQHQKSLKLLQQMGQDDTGTCLDNSLKGTAHTVKYLQDLIMRVGESEDEEEAETLVNLIWEFSRWVLLRQPEDGLRIFTASHETGKGIRPDKVYEHLKKVADRECRIAYLESLIKYGETGPKFHNELGYTYYEEIRKELDKEGAGKKHMVLVAKESGRLKVLRQKLITFLNSSMFYTARKMLLLLPEDELLEERAILLRRMKPAEHAQALYIYAHRLNSPAMAEEYCAKYYKENTDEQHMYLDLLRVHLVKELNPVPEPKPKPNIPAALELLAKHYNKLDHAKALELMPGDIPASSLDPFFVAVLRQNKHIRRENQVMVNLLRAENRQVMQEKHDVEGQRCVITTQSKCLRCGKRIGKAAFARQPDGRLMHYVCDIINQES